MQKMPSKSFVFYNKEGVPMDTFYLQTDTQFTPVERESRSKQQEAHDFSHGRNASSCQQTKVY